ncbi:MAG: hypothetical protein JNL10_15105 [Verrucomicrobiales bacterium]|nr:hypothetical protein [Verrucomicrobiales bacterium]
MTHSNFRLPGLLLLIALPLRGGAQVVINEILYHAPDELDDLQYVELFNAGSTCAYDASSCSHNRS